MFRKIVSLVLVFLSFAISEAVFAGTIPFPQKIDPTANTVTPGKIYKVNGSSYLVENKDGKIELTQLRDIGNLTTQLRTTVIYNSDGTFSSGNDAMNQPIAVTTLSAPADTPIGNPSHADAVAVAATAGIAATPPASADTSNGITVIVTEKIPGADCVEIPDSGSGVTTRKYKCTVKSWFSTVQTMLGGLIKYTTFLTALLGVLMIVYSGIQYATSAGDTKQQTAAVHRIQKLIGGLVLLFLMALILNTVAPWIYG